MHSLFRRANKAPAAVVASPPAPAPPMPMLSFPGKTALRFEGDTSAAERDSDLAVLMHSRNHVVAATERTSTAATTAAASALRAYLRIIYASELMSGSNQQKLRFAWRDDSNDDASTTGTAKKKKDKDKAAAAQVVQEHTSLETERAVALFALAAELSRFAAAADRRGPEGTRRACAALSDAAGALNAAAVYSRAHGDQQLKLCHMNEPCLVAFERLMLAQALECFFERAVAGGKHPALCSKIARQVSLDYQDVSVRLRSLLQQQQAWVPQVQAKAAYFDAEANLQYARSLREQQGPGCVGEAVARLRLAVSVLDTKTKTTGPLALGKKKSTTACAAAAVREAAAAVREAAARLRREAEAELAAAEKDNCQVYFERVPAADALSALPGLATPLVQPTAVEAVLSEADGEPALANGRAPVVRR